MKELNNMIDSLDDAIRIPFMMHHEGYKYNEIAEQFDLPLGTVKSRIFFARRALKDMIRKSYGDIYLVKSMIAWPGFSSKSISKINIKMNKSDRLG